MIHAPGEGITGLVALTGEPMAVADTTTDPRVAHRITDSEGITALIHVPLIVGGAVFGVFGVNYCRPHPVGAEEQRLLLSLAQRAALAIENAQLYAQAQSTAALEERQRLARELHDSVSQALYGIALGARTARTLLDRDPSQVARPLEYVLSLAEAGLAEMRALIFELRPESLETEGLVAALDKQAAALRARHQIEVRADLDDEPALPLEQKEALYRIAQEATHNTVKHARAGAIDLRLRCDDGVCVLDVTDDGIGFDPGGSFPGHLGLRSMRERAERLGGALELRSAPGAGTHLRASIPTGARVKREA
jgi:signal transduction histidine kinase